MKLQFFEQPVQAGFPSPTEGDISKKLDLNDHLIEHPAATFFVRAAGDSMLGAGIHPGDILIVDKALTPKSHSIIIALVNGEFNVKRLYIKDSCVQLLSENPKYPPLSITPEMDFEVWGVVTYVIHHTR